MNYIGEIGGMNFNPISNYNDYLNNTKSFDVDSSNIDFENVLNKQTASIQDPFQLKGGVELNNFDDIVAQTAVKVGENEAPTGHFMESFSNSISHGLSSVDDSIKTANKAQEALAMGKNVSVHDVMIAAEKASLNLQMAMQLRNKMITAYNEINNIRV